MKNEFAVIITSYNLGKYLKKAIDSVHKQTLKDVQLIVVDDCSDDPETVRILDEISNSVQVIRMKENKGVSSARNEGIRNSDSKYICCLDGDDYMEPTYLEKAKSIFESHKEVGIVACHTRCFGMLSIRWKVQENRTDLISMLKNNELYSASCVRREASVKAGMYDEKMRNDEDWEYWIRVIKDGWKVKVIPEYLFNYRQRKNSKREITKNNADINYSHIIRSHKKLYEKHLVEILSGKHLEMMNLLGYIGNLQVVRIALRILYLFNVEMVGCIPNMKSFKIVRIWSYPLSKCKKLFFKSFSKQDMRKVAENSNEFAVIITSYNLGKYLKKAIDSVHKQTLKDVQLVVVDDCSDDPETVRILDEISDSVQVIRMKENKGVSSARNEGIKNTNSKYICCLDADDYIEPTYLEKARNIFESHKEVGIVTCHIRCFGMLSIKCKVQEDRTDLISMLKNNELRSPSCCVRRCASVKAGMYDEKMGSHADWEYGIKIVKDSWKVKVIPEYLINYCRRKNSMWETSKGNSDIYYSHIINNHKELYEKHLVEILSGKHLEMVNIRGYMRSFLIVRIALYILYVLNLEMVSYQFNIKSIRLVRIATRMLNSGSRIFKLF